MPNILEVTEGFFGGLDADVARVPGRRLLEFGEVVRDFAKSTDTSDDVCGGCQYFGGWPSAAFLDVGGGVVQSSLLLSEQALVKDPVSDWFSLDQYSVSHKLGSAPGWLNPDTGPNMGETRRFLANVLPALSSVRSLVESGLIVFAPMERVYSARRVEIEQLHEQLCGALLDDVVSLSRRYSPSDLAHSDSLRGMFVVAGGEVEEQTRKAFRTALFYVAREYVTSSELGATYCAPFDFERFVCASGMGRPGTGSDRARECLLRSKLPIFQGLTPELLTSLHNDDRFASLREDIHRIYGAAPIADGDAAMSEYIEDQERTLLQPLLEATAKDLDRGLLSRLGLSTRGSTFQLAAGIGIAGSIGAGALSGSVLPTVLGTAAVLADQIRTTRRVRRQQPLWTALVQHSRSPVDEVPVAQERSGVGLVAAVNDGDTNPWGIPEVPSMAVSVLPGIVRSNWIGPPVSASDNAIQGYQHGEYVPCPCGSALKYRFCCADVDRRYRRDSRQL